MFDIRPTNPPDKPYELISLEDPEGRNRIFRMPRKRSSHTFTRHNRRTGTSWSVTIRRFSSDDGVWKTEVTWEGKRSRSFL